MEVSCGSDQCAEVIGVCRPVQPVVVYKKLKSINLYIGLFRFVSPPFRCQGQESRNVFSTFRKCGQL